MKTTELRIGNFIKYGADTLSVKQFTERTILLNGLRDTLINIDSESAEPIPLTEEWLINLGFEKGLISTGNKEEYGYSKNLLMLLRFQESDNWYACPYGYPIGIERTFHVHQLQNIFYALTGKELTHKKIN